MDIHHLTIFSSVYRNRSFSRASEELGLSQPTVTEHMKKLESELGRKLFDRTGRAIYPTREAEILYSRSLEVLDAMDRLKDDMASAGGKIGGELIIGASTIPGTYILPSLASEFRKDHESVTFEIVIEDSRRIGEMVLSHDLMLGVVGSTVEDKRLEQVPFMGDRLILACSDGVIKKDSVGINELAGIPFILREEGSGTRRNMETYLESRGLDVRSLNVGATLGSTDAVKQALLAGLGASILSNLAVEAELRSGLLKEIKIRGAKITRSFHLITHKKRTLPGHYQAFYDYLSGR